MQELLALKDFIHYIAFLEFFDIAALLALPGQERRERMPVGCSVWEVLLLMRGANQKGFLEDSYP